MGVGGGQRKINYFPSDGCLFGSAWGNFAHNECFHYLHFRLRHLDGKNQIPNFMDKCIHGKETE